MRLLTPREWERAHIPIQNSSRVPFELRVRVWSFLLGMLVATGAWTIGYLLHNRHHIAVCQPGWRNGFKP